MNDIQKHFFDRAKFIINIDNTTPKLRGVLAHWKPEESKLYITYFFDQEISESEIEDSWDYSVGIISAAPEALYLNEDFERIDKPKPLPQSDYWAWLNKDEIL